MTATPQLPAATQDLLREMAKAGKSKGYSSEASKRYSGYLKLLHLNGWPYQSMASALGCSRQAVEQRVHRAQFFAGLPDTPIVPKQTLKPVPIRKRRKLLVRDDVVADLRELHAVARTVNGVTPKDHPARAATQELTSALASLVDQGISISQLAEVLGVTPFAISARLARHGFRKLAPSQSHCRYQSAAIS